MEIKEFGVWWKTGNGWLISRADFSKEEALEIVPRLRGRGNVFASGYQIVTTEDARFYVHICLGQSVELAMSTTGQKIKTDDPSCIRGFHDLLV